MHDAEADPRNGDPGSTGRRRVAPAPKPRRQPYVIRMADDGPFCFAALWDVWRPAAPADAAQGAAEDAPEEAQGDAARPWLVTCTLITTAPNRVLGAIHDRMPVIVPPERYDAWLARDTTPEAAAALLTPYPDAAMRAYPVSTWVNAPAHDDPAVLEPLPPDAPT